MQDEYNDFAEPAVKDLCIQIFDHECRKNLIINSPTYKMGQIEYIRLSSILFAMHCKHANEERKELPFDPEAA